MDAHTHYPQVDISYLSAFPNEAEYLYPPLTFLKPTGRQQLVEAKAMTFTVIEVEAKV